MTDAINFFQSFKNFGFFSSPAIDNSSERKLSRELIKDARQFIQSAEIEAGNAAKAKRTFSANEANLERNLANIIVWHLENAARNYRQAAARYDEASRLRHDQQTLLKGHSAKCSRLATEAETSAEFLRGF